MSLFIEYAVYLYILLFLELSKIMERMINYQLMKYMKFINFISNTSALRLVLSLICQHLFSKVEFNSFNNAMQDIFKTFDCEFSISIQDWIFQDSLLFNELKLSYWVQQGFVQIIFNWFLSQALNSFIVSDNSNSFFYSFLSQTMRLHLHPPYRQYPN